MSIAFSELCPETVTTICNTNETNIDLFYAFMFIPIKNQDNELTDAKRRGNKIIIPSALNIPGEIISMRYNGMCRGMKRTDDVPCFRHSIIIDIGTKRHPLSIKLTNGKISITGPYSHLLTSEIIAYMNENLEIAQKRIDSFKSDIENFQESGELVLSEECKYLESEYTVDEIKGFANIFLEILEEEDANVCEDLLRLESSYTAMVNLNFDLGYPVRLSKLVQILSGNGFEAYSNNIRSRKCRIIIKDVNERADKKEVVHTITIAKTGCVRYSGPSLELMEPIYNKLVKIIEENRDSVEIKNVNLISPYRNEREKKKNRT